MCRRRTLTPFLLLFILVAELQAQPTTRPRAAGVPLDELAIPRPGEVTLFNGDRVTGMISAFNNKVTITHDVFGTITADPKDIRWITLIPSATLPSTLPTTAPATLPVATTTTAPSTIATTQDATAESAKPQAAKPKVWSGSVVGGALATRGNSDTEIFNLRFDATRTGERNTLTLAAGYAFGQQEDQDTGNENTTTNNWFAQARLDHNLSERFYDFALVRLEGDEVADLNLRASPGVGIGYRWILRPLTHLNTEAGITWVYEDYEGGGHNEHFAVRLAYHFDHKFNDKVALVHNVEYLPAIVDPSNFNLNADIGLRTDLTTKIFAEGKIEWRHDSTPAPDASRNDLRYILGVGFKF
jgi:putative salt-induced outer membrane protein YdiY